MLHTNCSFSSLLSFKSPSTPSPSTPPSTPFRKGQASHVLAQIIVYQVEAESGFSLFNKAGKVNPDWGTEPAKHQRQVLISLLVVINSSFLSNKSPFLRSLLLLPSFPHVPYRCLICVRPDHTIL